MPTIISVASGKGGVGKSSLVVNLSLRLQESYGPTLLVDSDLSMANSHILLNTQPKTDIVDVLEGHSELRMLYIKFLMDWPFCRAARRPISCLSMKRRR
jgi:flagellar biosynthesis protein FlhG